MITEKTKAILLLSSFFSSKETKEFKPLTVNEYGYFACWLHLNGLEPESLLNTHNLTDIWMKWEQPLSHTKAKAIIRFERLEKTIEAIVDTRINALLNRGASLSMALEKWQSAGVWVMDRSHPHYPKAFKTNLKEQSPAILFGVGNPELLQNPSIGFVGSRDCDEQDNQATQAYVDSISQLGYQVVSGGAKGVDSNAMEYALKQGNNAIGILADSLFKSSAMGRWRQYLKSSQLVLISPFYPESRFTAPNAMHRNKFIYLLSKATVVVTSSQKGGTWSGAKENLHKAWVPLLVSSHKSPLQDGNNGLLTGQGLPKGYPLGIRVTPDMSSEQLLQCIQQPIKPQTAQSELESSNTTDTQQSMFEQDFFSQPELRSELVEESQLKTGNLSFKERAIPKTERQASTTEQKPEQANKDEQHKQVNVNRSSSLLGESEQRVISTEVGAVQGSSPNTQRLTSVSEDLEKEQEQAPVEMLESTPLLDYFYAELLKLMQQSPEQTLDYQTIANTYPEFSIMGKKALEHWLNHFIENNKLIRPTSAKRYKLPLD